MRAFTPQLKSVPIRVLVLFLLLSPCAWAELRLPAVFSDNMVLQTGQPLPVWGWAAPGEVVSVQLQSQKVTARAGADGQWKVTLKPVTADDVLSMTVATVRESRAIKNILVGEVWLCSGQSNMQWSMNQLGFERQEIDKAHCPTMRLFQVKICDAAQPQTDVTGAWTECTPATAADFSALAYYFGRELQRDLKRPIGLIQSCAGGTVVQQWMSPQSLDTVPGFDLMLKRFEQGKTKYQKDFALYEQAKARWEAAGGAKSGQAAPVEPRQDLASLYSDVAQSMKQRVAQYWLDKATWESQNGARSGRPAPAIPVQETILPAPSRLWGGMIQPLVPFAIKGVIWYQGEGNTGDPYNFTTPYQYRAMFPALIKSWRKEWGQGDLPFYYCQLANWTAREKPEKVLDPANPEARTTFPVSDSWPEHSWPELREAQTEALGLPNTGMAVLIDIGDAYNIHPKNKPEAGRRLARLALANTYGSRVVCSGPCYTGKIKEVNGTAVLGFESNAGQLVAAGGALKGFSVAGKDRRFVPAQARIEGSAVVVWSPEVPKPVAVRYAWTVNPWATLFNQEGLPAAPFRTDSWPLKRVNQVEGQ